MSPPTTEPRSAHRRFNMRGWRAWRPLGLPMFEAVCGVVFFLGMLAVLALALYSAFEDGPVSK